MSEETRDEWARDWIPKLSLKAEHHQLALAEVLKSLQIVKDWNEDLSKRVEALETALRNQPANDGL